MGRKTVGAKLAGWIRLARSNPEANLILDVDDDDVALSREFRALSLANRIRINRARPLHPARIQGVMRQALYRADGFTVASKAVAQRLGQVQQAVLTVPHPRSRVAGLTTTAATQ